MMRIPSRAREPSTSKPIPKRRRRWFMDVLIGWPGAASPTAPCQFGRRFHYFISPHTHPRSFARLPMKRNNTGETHPRERALVFQFLPTTGRLSFRRPGQLLQAFAGLALHELANARVLTLAQFVGAAV